MLGLGTLTRYSGVDATLGLAFAHTGVIYPFFAALLGWLGVALTGSDTASNVLFGGLQVVTANKLGLSPILMAATNSSGGVMGKMIDAQSIVVASTATNWYGHEGTILRFVFKHSIALACLVGVLVMLQAYVAPFTEHGDRRSRPQPSKPAALRSAVPIRLCHPRPPALNFSTTSRSSSKADELFRRRFSAAPARPPDRGCQLRHEGVERLCRL